MKEMGWSWKDLHNTPECVFLSVTRIINLSNKEERRKESEAEISRKYNAAARSRMR